MTNSRWRRWRDLGVRLREYLELDCTVIRVAAALAGAMAGACLFLLTARRLGFRLLAKAHRSNASQTASRFVEHFLQGGPRRRRALVEVFRRHLGAPRRTPRTKRFFDDPGRLLGARLLVLKEAREREKGIIVLDYNFMFPIFGACFDVPRVASRYHVVLEPSWSGYCDLDIVSFSQYPFPVFIQATEPRDAAFIERLGGNFRVVPTSGNWWVDHRVMRPVPDIAKEFDFVYLAAWAKYKRHARLFEALSRLRRRGVRFTLLLAGYPADLTMDDIFHQAKEFGLGSTVAMRERLAPPEVNLALNRSKVNLLWSRREGFNRAVIEGMLAGTPCVIREGFNFGHPYPYVNSSTGCFATEEALPERLIWMRDNHEAFSPRAWVMENMSCQLATRILGAKVREVAERAGEPWTADPVVKVTFLDRMSHWDPADKERLAEDYAFLRAAIRDG